MEKEIVLLDLFAGMGGFAKGFEDAGFTIKKHYFSEIDKNAIANYRLNFKNSEYVGPVTDIRGASLGKVDVITFGSPCQDFSIAGKRSGLDGERSSLVTEAIRLISEKKPRFFIWENVKGAYSSNGGADFWAIIQAFANLGLYRLEWQLLNTLWLLPQNRERIYLVGHLAEPGRNFGAVFPFTKNDRLFNESQGTKTRQPQTEFCKTLGKGSLRADSTYIEYPKTAGAHSGGLHSDMTIIKAEYFSNHQQDRIYEIDGAIGCLTKHRTSDHTKIKVYSSQPRTGDPKKGGTGLLQKEDETYCLDTQNSNVISQEQEQYRRLTEIECERLQGFPDDWTKFGVFIKSKKVNKYLFSEKKNWLTPTVKGKLMVHAHSNFKTVTDEIAATNRYGMIGNAVTTNFPKIIAQKLIENYYNH